MRESMREEREKNLIIFIDIKLFSDGDEGCWWTRFQRGKVKGEKAFSTLYYVTTGALELWCGT